MARSGRPAAAVAPAPVPADVGLVAALPIEVAPLLARFKNVRKYAGPSRTVVEGECAGKIVAVVVAGVGVRAAYRGAELLAAGHRPRWMLAAGFGGALDPARKRNDVVLIHRVVSEVEGEPQLEIDLMLPEARGGPASLVAGSLLTVSRIIRTPAEKAQLRQRYACDVVDMETYSVAAYCAARGIRCLPVRVISDEATSELPAEILSILGPTGGFRLGAAVGAIWKRPSSLKDLWGLREHAHEAAERLGAVLPGLIEQLP
jgi:adenosylhomocysteine nucleosidase